MAGRRRQKGSSERAIRIRRAARWWAHGPRGDHQAVCGGPIGSGQPTHVPRRRKVAASKFV